MSLVVGGVLRFGLTLSVLILLIGEDGGWFNVCVPWLRLLVIFLKLIFP